LRWAVVRRASAQLLTVDFFKKKSWCDGWIGSLCRVGRACAVPSAAAAGAVEAAVDDSAREAAAASQAAAAAQPRRRRTMMHAPRRRTTAPLVVECLLLCVLLRHPAAAAARSSPSQCLAELARDGCTPNQGGQKCGACAERHIADLLKAGCNRTFVTAYCEHKAPPGPAGHQQCLAELAKDGCKQGNPQVCGKCAHAHEADLLAAGCTVGFVTSWCENKGPPPPPAPPPPPTNTSVVNVLVFGKCCCGRPPPPRCCHVLLLTPPLETCE
jgi:hypothetical protein